MRKFAECKNESLLSWSLYLLDLSCNGISDLEPLPLTHLKNLNTLLLSYNNITSLPRDYFSDLNHLRYLNLSHNNLEVIQYGIFDTLLYLEILDLSCNHLINLGNRHFYYLNNLAQLYIDNNILNKFDLKSKNKFPRRLKYISLDDNNFSCNYVSELIQELTYSGIEVAEGKHHNVTNIQGIICQQDQPERSSYRSNILVIVLSVLGVAILILSIPWCIIYIKRSRTRRSVLEDIELM
ncbi:hypothetical protein JTB14_009915 [Gonioctena quinquepunctata]|nr:hypothetical protein JTB14_009915 [Gonioctena quinquepunctata]